MNKTQETIVNLVNEQYIEDVKCGLYSRSCYKITGDICETIGKLLVLVSGVLAYSASSWNNNLLSFIAGTMSFVSGGLFVFAAYAMKQSKSRTDTLNKIMTVIGDPPVVDISTNLTAMNTTATI
jgi:hypothetical protein